MKKIIIVLFLLLVCSVFAYCEKTSDEKDSSTSIISAVIFPNCSSGNYYLVEDTLCEYLINNNIDLTDEKVTQQILENKCELSKIGEVSEEDYIAEVIEKKLVKADIAILLKVKWEPVSSTYDTCVACKSSCSLSIKIVSMKTAKVLSVVQKNQIAVGATYEDAASNGFNMLIKYIFKKTPLLENAYKKMDIK